MASTRTDNHRAASVDFDPETYRFLGCFDFGSTVEAMASQRDYAKLVDELTAKGYHQFVGNGGCAHCGANIRWVGVLAHRTSGEWILVGETCLDTTFASTKAQFASLRAANKRNAKERLAHEKFTALVEQLTADPATARTAQALAYASYAFEISVVKVADDNGELVSFRDATRQSWALDTLSDIARKCQQYHNAPSDKQAELVEKLHVQLDRAAIELAERVSAKAATSDLIEGKRLLVGTVISTGEEETFYGNRPGYRFTMLVALDDGTRVFGTWPAGLPNEVKGLRVQFTATVKRSAKDRTFGSFSRPTGAKVV